MTITDARTSIGLRLVVSVHVVTKARYIRVVCRQIHAQLYTHLVGIAALRMAQVCW